MSVVYCAYDTQWNTTQSSQKALTIKRFSKWSEYIFFYNTDKVIINVAGRAELCMLFSNIFQTINKYENLSAIAKKCTWSLLNELQYNDN